MLHVAAVSVPGFDVTVEVDDNYNVTAAPEAAGGEVRQITDLISEGRHKAIERMEQEAQRDGAIGVTGVSTKLGRLAGFTEFLSQGTGVHPYQPGGQHRFFSTAASGIGLYCQLDAGYQPVRFSMGNIAYALGIDVTAAHDHCTQVDHCTEPAPVGTQRNAM